MFNLWLICHKIWSSLHMQRFKSCVQKPTLVVYGKPRMCITFGDKDPVSHIGTPLSSYIHLTNRKFQVGWGSPELEAHYRHITTVVFISGHLYSSKTFSLNQLEILQYNWRSPSVSTTTTTQLSQKSLRVCKQLPARYSLTHAVSMNPR